MAKPVQRAKAVAMRSNGFSIGEIVNVLGEKKSTVSYWCRDVSLTDQQLNSIAARGRSKATAALLKAAERRRAKRLQSTTELRALGARDVGRLTKHDLLLIGLALYWGEGYKRSKSELGFTNSDPEMIRTYLSWLALYGVQREQLILRVTINRTYVDQTQAIEARWSRELGIPRTQFTKPSIITTAQSTPYPSRSAYLGTLRIKVRNGSALLQRVLGALQHIARSTIPSVP